MKYYFTPDGVMGYVPWMGRYILFASESDYFEFYRESE